MIGITQECDSCGNERTLNVVGFGSASVDEATQMQRLGLALEEGGWVPLGDELWLDPSCVEKKLGIPRGMTTTNNGDIRIVHD